MGAGQGRGESQQLERSVACPLHPPLACPGIADTSFLPRVSLHSLPPPSSPPLHSEVLGPWTLPFPAQPLWAPF